MGWSRPHPRALLPLVLSAAAALYAPACEPPPDILPTTPLVAVPGETDGLRPRYLDEAPAAVARLLPARDLTFFDIIHAERPLETATLQVALDTFYGLAVQYAASAGDTLPALQLLPLLGAHRLRLLGGDTVVVARGRDSLVFELSREGGISLVAQAPDVFPNPVIYPPVSLRRRLPTLSEVTLLNGVVRFACYDPSRGHFGGWDIATVNDAACARQLSP